MLRFLRFLTYLLYMRGQKIRFELNEKIGKLTAIENPNKSYKSGRNKNRTIWLFRCECGNEFEAAAYDFKCGRKISCRDCYEKYQKELGNRLRIINTKPNKDGPITKLFGLYERAAKRRNYE